jgi:hypothetical protein
MNRKLPLSSFQVPAPEEVRFRMIRSIQLGAPIEAAVTAPATPEWPQARGLILTRTFARGIYFVGTLTTIGLLILTLTLGLGWCEMVQASVPPRRSMWAEGVVVSANVHQHSFVLAAKGRSSHLLFSWNGQTHQWNNAELAGRGQAVDPAALSRGRWARVFFQPQARGLLAKRIIFLSTSAGAPAPSPGLPGANS